MPVLTLTNRDINSLKDLLVLAENDNMVPLHTRLSISLEAYEKLKGKVFSMKR